MRAVCRIGWRSSRRPATCTWREFNAQANQLVRLFRKRGLAGRAMALRCSPTTARSSRIAWAATQRAGLRLTAVNWHQSPELIAYVVDNCDAQGADRQRRGSLAGATEAARSSRTSWS